MRKDSRRLRVGCGRGDFKVAVEFEQLRKEG